LGWCVVDDEDYEEDDGRRRKKMNNINPNVFFDFFSQKGPQQVTEINIKYSNGLFFS